MVIEMNFLRRVKLYVIGFDEHLMADRPPPVIIAPKVPSLALVFPSILLIVAHLDFILRRELSRQRRVIPGRKRINIADISLRKDLVIDIRRKGVPAQPEANVAIDRRFQQLGL